MAGYLRQLARRALNPGSPLHSMAALPYAEPPEWAQDAEPVTADSVSMAPSLETPRRVAAAASQEARAMPLAPRAARAERIHAAIDRPAGADAVTEPTQARALDAERRPRPAASEDGKAPVLAQRRETPAPIISEAEHQAAETPRQAPRTEPARRSTAAPPARERPPVPSREQRPTAVEAAPEVHIHIGRIELTAAAPAPAAPRRETATRKPMSLDDYLRSRGRSTP